MMSPSNSAIDTTMFTGQDISTTYLAGMSTHQTIAQLSAVSAASANA